MITKNGKEITDIRFSNKQIVEIYKSSRLVWGLLLNFSCFARGYWADEYPWTDDLPWSDKP